MMTVALIILGFVAAGVVLGLYAVASAPVGYQDEKGFHFGPEQTVHAEHTYGFEVPHAEAA